jgi:energy-converting hydrogenase Eha subunit C
MAQSFTGSVKVTLAHQYQNALDLTNVVDSLSKAYTDSFTDGTGSGKAQVVWHDQRTVATTTADDIDLAGVLTNAFGTVTFTKIAAILIKMQTETTGYTLEVGGDAIAPLDTLFDDTSDIIVIGAGGMFLITSPVDKMVVTGDTADILQIYNPSGGSVVYDIWVIGEGSIA